MQLIRLALILPLVLLAACSNSLSTRTGEALAIVRGFQSSDHPVPTAVFENAKGVAILREGSAAFVVGGSGGQGVFLKRAEHGWSAPVAINTGGATIGLQAGAQSRDIIIVMNTAEEVANFLDDGMYGLAEASAVAGPAKTDPNNAGGPVPATYYYLRTEGLFGGLLVGGVYFSTADKINREQYGPDVSVGDITSGKVKAPAGSEILWKALN
jgi:lipid-binding SYLF domain-containing protein